VPGRYAFHDLLRAYATEQARDRDDDGARRAALGRLLDHWLHTACAAAALLDPFFAPVPQDTPLPGAVVGAPATAEEALRWFTAEQATLLAAVPLAAWSGLAGHAWRLAWALSTFLLRRGCWDDYTRACRASLDAARRAGDVAGEAHALLLLALGDARSGRRDATPAFRESLRLFETVDGYHRSQVTAHSSLIWIAEQQERYGDMLGHAVRALRLSRAAGDQTMEIMSLNDVGYSHARLGNYGQAIAYCGQALAGSRAAGERNWESAAWDSLGYIHHKLGDHHRAVTCYERSLDLCRELADRYNEAGTLDRLGDVHHSAGDLRAARWAWAQALRTLDELGAPRRRPGPGQDQRARHQAACCHLGRRPLAGPVTGQQRGGVVGHVSLHVPWRADVPLGRRPRRQLQRRLPHLVVGDRAEQVGDHVDAGVPLVLALHHVPRRLGDVGVDEHLVLGPGVIFPVGDRLQVHGRQLPPAQRVVQPGLEAALLLFVADREPVLAQQDAVLDEQPLEDRALVHEPAVLLLGAEPHHVLHAARLYQLRSNRTSSPAAGRCSM
jgi:tetratricopeptide (TPR) repeat protein